MSSQTSHRIGADGGGGGADAPSGGATAKLAFAWAFVGIPLAYGVLETAKKAAALFTG